MDLQTLIAQDVALSFWKMQGGVDDDHHHLIPGPGDLQVAFDILRGNEMYAIRTFLASLPVIDLLPHLPPAVVAWAAQPHERSL